MRDEILAQMTAALPLDGVLLGLHGAMVAHGYDDVEGDLIERARAIVGAKCVIGVELDPHCHLTLKRVRTADIIILYKEFPHTDVVDRAEEVLDLTLAATLRGDVKPVMSLYDCRQIGSYPTTLPLMRGFVDRIKAIEGKDGILSISVVHCFPYADVAELTRPHARRRPTATRPRPTRSRRGSARSSSRCAADDAAVPRRCRRRRSGDGLQRRPGGHRRSGRQRRRRRAFRQHDDPAPADRAAARTKPRLARSGIRSPCASVSMPASAPTFPLRFGGKTGPVRARRSTRMVEVTALARDCWQSFGPTKVPLGDCAAVRIDGVEVVLITKRTQALGLELFSNLGIDPLRQEHPGRQVDQPLHGRLRADRQAGDLRRQRCAR